MKKNESITGAMLGSFAPFVENLKEMVFLYNTYTPEERLRLNLWTILSDASHLCSGGQYPNVEGWKTGYIDGLKLIASSCVSHLDHQETERLRKFIDLTKLAFEHDDLCR